MLGLPPLSQLGCLSLCMTLIFNGVTLFLELIKCVHYSLQVELCDICGDHGLAEAIDA